MGCVIAGIVFGVITIVLLIVGFAFLDVAESLEGAGVIGGAFLFGAVVSGIISFAAFHE